MKTNTILNGDVLTHLKELPSESINCVMTSPPYWALRDYGTARWEGGDKDCNHIINKTTELKGDWERPSRKEFNKVGEVLECVVCKKQFKGKLGNKFCSTKCLNKLSNEERTNAKSKRINECSICGAKRVDYQLGLEPTFEEYINHLCNVFDEVKRVLRKDGTCWVNLGDTYGGSGVKGEGATKNSIIKAHREGHSNMGNQIKGYDKCLLMIPSRFAIEMVNRGWILRNVIIWHKPNCMPSSVKDRFTVDFEYLFFFVKSKKYWFETQYEPTIEPYSKKRAIRPITSHGKEPTPQGQSNNLTYNKLSPKGRNKRTVWSINPKPFPEAHFAVYPEKLCETPIKAGCPEGGIVLDPFFGSGTTGLVALKQNKRFIGIELNPEYIKIAKKRLKPFLEQIKLL